MQIILISLANLPFQVYKADISGYILSTEISQAPFEIRLLRLGEMLINSYVEKRMCMFQYFIHIL